MRRSIQLQLTIGLLLAGLISGVVMAVFVAHHYGLLSASPPPLMVAWREISDHVIVPILIFTTTFGLCAAIVLRSVTNHLRKETEKATASAQRLDVYLPQADGLPSEIAPFAQSLSDLSIRLKRHAELQEEFAQDAAHELKTPLAIMELELDQVDEPWGSRMKANIQSLAGLIDQLLLLSRSQSAQAADTAQWVDLGEIAASVVGDLAPYAVHRGKDVALRDLGAGSMTGLEEALSTAIRTLTINALEATPEGGSVTIEAGPGRRIVIYDDGPGIPPDRLSSLLARGKRMDESTKSGTGLGLAIASRIVEAHGGEIQSVFPQRSAIEIIFSG
ncbi:sensor histidine kinase [Parvularcula lutaonensis]|uniref:histidine kinase n=1 Tax=Parvularcula lutaonensis TaxID=491923 RepID=A0ABV7MAR3_9PROT|nr:HAMP domain-containing sensor histidine kinase [Parvularcula lutaonensis]GGY37761.1 hypothetical protein GCM10007148_02540 [Parvularcula lutaonensis]